MDVSLPLSRSLRDIRLRYPAWPPNERVEIRALGFRFWGGMPTLVARLSELMVRAGSRWPDQPCVHRPVRSGQVVRPAFPISASLHVSRIFHSLPRLFSAFTPFSLSCVVARL